MSPRPPTFFIAGVPKAGTTSLYYYLAQHPQVFMSRIKEPTFFAAADLVTNERFRRRQAREQAARRAFLAGPQRTRAPFYVTEWADYLQLFRDAGAARAIGEASAGYWWLPSAAGAIHARLPAARLLFILRDPAERLFSWYLLSLANHPGRTFRDWYLAERTPRADWWSAVDGGRYATHLERFRTHFPADQLRCYLYEDLRRDAAAVVRDAFAFVGVDPDVPIDTTTRYNETSVPRFPALHRLRGRLLGHVSGAWLPAALRRPLRRWYYGAAPARSLDAADRRLVIDHHRDEILRTAELIGRDLSAWLR